MKWANILKINIRAMTLVDNVYKSLNYLAAILLPTADCNILPLRIWRIA